MKFTAPILMLTWLVFENVCTSLGENEMFTKFTTSILMLRRLVFENVCNSSRANEMFMKFTPWIVMRTWHVFQNVCNSRFILKLIKMHHDWKGTFIATFQENPCARVQNMHLYKDLRALLSSPLFMRILVRESKRQNSKQKKHATIQTRNRKPRQQKATFAGPMFTCV